MLTVHRRHYRFSLPAFNFAEADARLRGATVGMYAVLHNKLEEYVYIHPLGCSKLRDSLKSRLTRKSLIIDFTNMEIP